MSKEKKKEGKTKRKREQSPEMKNGSTFSLPHFTVVRTPKTCLRLEM